MNILDCIIKMKGERRDHYRQLADYAADKDLKRIALLLAEANNELIGQVNSIRQNSENIPELAAVLSETACVFKPNFDSKHPDVSLQRDSDAYLHVIREIGDAVEFYELLAAEAGQGEVKDLYARLAAMERAHLNVVENIYAFVEDPKTYLEWGEFSNLKSL